jgi:putative transposase
MKRTRFIENQIIRILKEQESGRSVTELCREYGVHQATFYNWKSKYGDMNASQLKRLKELEDENLKLKKMYVKIPVTPVCASKYRLLFSLFASK